MTLKDMQDLELINQAISDFNELARMMMTDNVAEAEHWLLLLRKQWAARAYYKISGEQPNHFEVVK